MDAKYILGVDFGTDSVRVIVLDCRQGQEIASAVSPYLRWQQGLYCDVGKKQFRQHPLDLIEAWQQAAQQALASLSPSQRRGVVAIGVDTTGSSPCAVDRHAQPLALNPEFAQDPDAMVVLWKDHSAAHEAERINRGAAELLEKKCDYLRFVGGTYSCEWFWAKLLHVFAGNPRVEQASAGWMEHSDWFPAMLCGIKDIDQVKINRCAAGHKALWNEQFGGLPPASFFGQIDPLLAKWRARLYQYSWDMGSPMGQLSAHWASLLGLSPQVLVSVGIMDSHAGALGAGIKEHDFVRVMGTSTCDLAIVNVKAMADRSVSGICGQVVGSVMPGYVGLEAGQSSFGDCFHWLRNLLAWPLRTLALATQQPDSWREQVIAAILPELNRQAAALAPGAGGEVALDWFNARRTPHANPKLRAAIEGLHLGSDAPALFRALAEALAYGTRAILEVFEQQGVSIQRVVGVGGVAHKSPLTMQILADVLQREIQVAQSQQCCALGAAITGAMAAGVFPNWQQALSTLSSPIIHSYHPNRDLEKRYDELYHRYQKLGAFEEKNHP